MAYQRTIHDHRFLTGNLDTSFNWPEKWIFLDLPPKQS